MELSESETDSHSFSSTELPQREDSLTASKKVRFYDDKPEVTAPVSPTTFGPSETESESEDSGNEESVPLTNQSGDNLDKINNEPLNSSTMTPSDLNSEKQSKYSKLKTNLFAMPRKLMNGTVFTTFDGSERERAVDVGHLGDDQLNSSVPPPPYDDANANVIVIKGQDQGDEEPKKELTRGEKVCNILIGVGKAFGLIFSFYLFVCSLDLLSDGFRLAGGRTASEIFKNSAILQNPVVGVMIGILTTVLVQSSSTSTSIIVGMVSANFLEVPVAIPLIMGANIGTSISNTIVSFAQAGDRDQFRLAFAGATILDMFNWITVIVLLTVEIFTGYLYHTTSAILKGLVPDKGMGEFQMLTVLTKPFVDLILQLDNAVMDCWAHPNCTEFDNASLILEHCRVSQVKVEISESVSDAMGQPISQNKSVLWIDVTSKCDFIFAGTSLSDGAVGAIVLVLSLIVLCSCLIFMVKILSSILQGHVAEIIKKTLNANIPYVPWLTGYLAILVGAVMTFLVQSSSVFTSAITPLIGLEVISLERAYPLTLGANIGTTTTALLASMAVEGESFFPAMQIALCHVLFNVTGVLLFYPIPFLRLPLPMARFLGNTTAKYRWFAIFYLIFMFALLPAATIGLAFSGRIPVIVVFSLLGILALFIIVLTVIQRKRPSILPVVLQSWKFLPLPLRSLQPYDELLTRWTCCKNMKKSEGDEEKTIPFSNNNIENTQQEKENLPIQNLQASPIPRSRRRDVDKRDNMYPFAEDEV